MDLINGIAFGRGVEAVLMDIATEEPVFLAIMDRRARFFLELCERALQAAKGGVDILFMGDDYGTQSGLQHGAPEAIRTMVLQRIETMSPGGGYICAPSHNIQPDTPLENVLAMYEAIHECR